MTACYGIALSLDWERPYWAGFVVAFCSLASIGQSLNQTALRMAGTLVGVVVTLALIGLLAQDRWPFIPVLLMYVGTCSYIGSGSRHTYFWIVSAFFVVIVSMDAGPDPINAFQTAMLRAEETGLGVLVYSLVAIFLWPNSSSGVFNASVVELASIQRQAYQALAKGPGEDQQAQRLLAQGVPHFQRASLAVMKSISRPDSMS